MEFQRFKSPIAWWFGDYLELNGTVINSIEWVGDYHGGGDFMELNGIDVQKPYWLVISSGIILPSLLGMIIIQ